MMLFLVQYVSTYFFHARLTDGKRRIARLPLEPPVASPIIRLHPSGARFLYRFHNLHQGMLAGEAKQRVHMVIDSTDHDGWTLPLSENAG